jgi:hypothetical protein
MITRIKWTLGRLEKCLFRCGVFDRRKLCLPDFLGIGAQKAGTTWLYENLRLHPDLFLPRPKELHFFDWHFYGTLRSYARNFEPGRGKVKGEITPGYSIVDRRRIKFIHWLLPDVRLLMLIRNPMERAWSQALMNLVKKPGRPFKDVPESEFLDHIASERSVKRGDYLATLDAWLSRYRPEQLLIGFFEDIRERPRDLLRRIFKHIGVRTDVDWSAFPYDRVIFKGMGAEAPPAVRETLREMYRDDLRRLVERFGPAVKHWQEW